MTPAPDVAATMTPAPDEILTKPPALAPDMVTSGSDLVHTMTPATDLVGPVTGSETLRLLLLIPFLL
jgi:hypothetical protein